jgi:glycosyltransferase involved in cell wall biosynthesis
MDGLKKILYITDQQEYSENGTISTLFDIYLQEYYEVHIVYLTKYKEDFAQKGTHYIVPNHERGYIIEYLVQKGVDISSFSFVIVRNKKDALKDVLKNRNKYGYKIALRISYPKKHHKLEVMQKTTSPLELFKSFMYKRKIKERDALANKCDLFLPPSVEAGEVFYPNITIDSFPVFIGLDPDKLTSHLISNDEVKKFIYAGTIDTIRQFHVILDALAQVEKENWQLTITTTNKIHIRELLKSYPTIRNKINLVSAMSLKELNDQINEHDVGIALMPRNNFYDTVIADKVINYYTCGVPAIVTANEKNNSIFNQNEAIFCKFDTQSIASKIEEIIEIPNQDLAKIGNAGQEKLLSIQRNYKILAKNLANKLDEIVQK